MLIQRLKSALPIVAVVCLAFFLPRVASVWVFGILGLGMILLTEYELLALLKPQLSAWQSNTLLFLSLCFVIFPILGYAFDRIYLLAWMMEIVLLMVACLTVFLLTFNKQPTKDSVTGIMTALGGTFFITWMLSLLVKIYYFPSVDTRLPLFFLILITKMGDVGAFFVGSTAAKRPQGTHKLAPFISPNKSWEGLAGGVVFSLATALIFRAFFSEQTILFGWWATVVFGLLAAPVGLLGDLIESAIKRAAEQKDSGCLPGIGGILDTLDSLIPMGALFLLYFAGRLC